jgi:nitronate monooxygenase
MAMASGGRLAAAVTSAGGLGLIGGGYGDGGFLEREFRAAGNQRVGCGFITWSLARQPALLDLSLAHRPAAVMLSFGDPAPFAPAIRAAGASLICQCQTIAHAREALAAGADIIVAQGAEAGGHGQSRGTLTLVPETADLLAREAPETLLVAAGGIADGRGLAAALMLGADGVLLGTRLWASDEALTHPNHQRAAIAAGGDDTLRTTAVDIVRRLDWPEGFTIRVGRNDFTDRWHGREAALREVVETEAAAYQVALSAGDARASAPVHGEAAGLIHAVEPAGSIIARMVDDAAGLLSRHGPGLVSD